MNESTNSFRNEPRLKKNIKLNDLLDDSESNRSSSTFQSRNSTQTNFINETVEYEEDGSSDEPVSVKENIMPVQPNNKNGANNKRISNKFENKLRRLSALPINNGNENNQRQKELRRMDRVEDSPVMELVINDSVDNTGYSKKSSKKGKSKLVNEGDESLEQFNFEPSQQEQSFDDSSVIKPLNKNAKNKKVKKVLSSSEEEEEDDEVEIDGVSDSILETDSADESSDEISDEEDEENDEEEMFKTKSTKINEINKKNSKSNAKNKKFESNSENDEDEKNSRKIKRTEAKSSKLKSKSKENEETHNSKNEEKTEISNNKQKNVLDNSSNEEANVIVSKQTVKPSSKVVRSESADNSSDEEENNKMKSSKKIVESDESIQIQTKSKSNPKKIIETSHSSEEDKLAKHNSKNKSSTSYSGSEERRKYSRQKSKLKNDETDDSKKEFEEENTVKPKSKKQQVKPPKSSDSDFRSDEISSSDKDTSKSRNKNNQIAAKLKLKMASMINNESNQIQVDDSEEDSEKHRRDQPETTHQHLSSGSNHSREEISSVNFKRNSVEKNNQNNKEVNTINDSDNNDDDESSLKDLDLEPTGNDEKDENEIESNKKKKLSSSNTKQAHLEFESFLDENNMDNNPQESTQMHPNKPINSSRQNFNITEIKTSGNNKRDDSDPIEIIGSSSNNSDDDIKVVQSRPPVINNAKMNMNKNSNNNVNVIDMTRLDDTPKKQHHHHIKEERQIAGWSPNSEWKAKQNIIDNKSPVPNLFDKAKQRALEAKQKQEAQLKQMKPMNMEDTKPMQPKLNEEPHKVTLQDLKYQGSVMRGPNTQIINRNLSFEEKLKELSEGMFKILEEKPDDTLSYENMEMPKSLKVKLLAHQRYSMKWLKWREKSYPHGAILADDMGLGKTLTILTYLKMVKDKKESDQLAKIKKKQKQEEENEEEDQDDEFNYKKIFKKKQLTNRTPTERLRTLIILPASLLHQWENEIKDKFERDSFKYHVYHEANRKKFAYNMDDNDIVFTTYEIVAREIELNKEGEVVSRDSPLLKIKWKRIILDEAHRIKNHTTKVNKTVCILSNIAKYKIAITGTPVHNSLDDLYSLVKFLHFDPLEDFQLWNYIFKVEKKTNNNNARSMEREKRSNAWIVCLSDYILLRRAKTDNIKGTDKKLVDLPDKNVELVKFKLNYMEKTIYDMIFKESKEKVKKFLKNRQMGINGGTSMSDILIYLLRLRQACCHMSLLNEVLDKDEIRNLEVEADGIESMMQNLSLNCKPDLHHSTQMSQLDILKENSEDVTICMERSFESSKLMRAKKMAIELLDEFPEDKIIIVSQWTSILNIMGENFERNRISYYEIRGDVSLDRRSEVMSKFNDPENTGVRVLLLSLNAGGVGLNLVGANRMFLLDIHWNPALESQASDRIYRVGQTKNVTIYRFICEETIEERIEQIQKVKIALAQKVCSASASNVPGMTANAGNTKLTINDFKLLFEEFN